MKKFAACALFALAAIAAGACSKSNVRDPNALQSIENPALRPDQVWSQSTGGTDKRYAAFKLNLQTDALFAADADGNVYAFNPQTGKQIWRTRTAARVVSGPGIASNLVLVGTLDAEVIALNRADGAPLWRAKVSSEVMAPAAAEGNTVLVRTVDGLVHGLAADTGARLWIFDRSTPPLTLRGLSEPLIVGNRVYVGMDNGRLAALDIANGQPLWEQAVAVASGRTELDRLTDIDAALIPGSNGIFAVSFGGELASLDPDNGEVQWRRSIKSYSGMTQLGELIVATDDSGTVWALDAKTGAAAWKQEALQYRRLSPPAAFGGYAVVGDLEGYLHWLDPKDGRIVARTRAGRAPIRSAPVASADLLYVLDTAGKISALTVKP